MLTIDTWNEASKDEECNAKAIDGDLVEEIDGVLFLIQRKDDYNNIICFRIEETDVPFWTTILKLRTLCLSHGIFYIRVEGSTKRYIFLKAAIQKFFPNGEVSIIQDLDIKNRNVFYIKLI